MGRKWLSFEVLQSVVGEAAAHALCRNLGGLSWYLPVSPEAAHPVAAVAGMEALRALCGLFAPGMVTIPKSCRRTSRKCDIITRLERGLACRDIALELGVTDRYVQHVRRETGLGARPGDA